MESKPLRRLVFGHRVKDVKPALRDRSQDIRRMKACFHDAGYEISEEDLAAAWLSYSEGASVDWLTLPSSDGQLLATLLGARAPLLRDPSRPHRQWKAQLVDVDDGSGDQILELPDDLMAALGWSIDDTLELSRLPSGDVRLRKVADSPV